jgi:AraC-like DNA-binding protein
MTGASPRPAGRREPSPPCVLAYVQRDRTRDLLRAAFPRRRGRLVIARSQAECLQTLRAALVDAVIVDLAATDETWRVAALSREFPSAAFFGVAGLRVGEGGLLAAGAGFDFVDIVAEGVDESVAQRLVAREGFSARFARALQHPPSALGLDAPLQRNAWRYIVAHAALPVRTAALAEALHVTREHLSRVFASDGAPNLKRVIDLVRLLVAAELAKNPGHDIVDVARVLGFASASHLSATATRVAGTKPASLTRLRTSDLISRFARDHARSRGPGGQARRRVGA